MLVEKDDTFSQDVLQKIYAHLTEGREDRTGKWHVSDLLFPRYAVLQRLEGVKPTPEDVGFFFTGEAYHQMIQKVMGQSDSEIRLEKHNVLGTADFLNDELLIEFKTSRKWTIPEWPQEHYLEQIGYYAAMSGKTKARVVVIFPTAGRKWNGTGASTVEIATWVITWTLEELAAIELKMRETVILLDTAVKSFDLSPLPLCPIWKFGSIQQDPDTKKYEVKTRCPFAHICVCQQSALQTEADKKNLRVGSRGGKRGF